MFNHYCIFSYIFGGHMAADVKFSVKRATDDQSLIPTNVNVELEQKFLKKSKADAIKLIPISFGVSAVVIAIIVLLVTFLRIFAISTFAILCIILPIYGIYNAVATSKAIKNHDYEFFYGEVTDKTDNGNYIIKGLEDQKISVLFGKKEYNAGDRVIVARMKDELNLISEE